MFCLFFIGKVPRDRSGASSQSVQSDIKDKLMAKLSSTWHAQDAAWALWAYYISLEPAAHHESIIRDSIGAPQHFIHLFKFACDNDKLRDDLDETTRHNLLAIKALITLKEEITKNYDDQIKLIDLHIQLLNSMNKAAEETLQTAVHAKQVSDMLDIDHVYNDI